MTSEAPPSEATLLVFEDRFGADKTSGIPSEAPVDVEMQDVNDANGERKSDEQGRDDLASSERKGPADQELEELDK